MGIRIDALDAAASAQADHEIPAMRDGATVKLTAEQLATFIVALVTDSAPATLDTLNELAAALGDDPNFATTVTNSLAEKASLTGSETLTNKTLTSPTINTPTLVLKQSASPTPTAEGAVEWDNNDDNLVVGNGSSQSVIRSRPIVLWTSVTASGTSVPFPDIPSGARRITVMFADLSTNGSSLVLLQLGDAGGLESTDYRGTSSIVTSSSATAITSSTSGFQLPTADASALRTGVLTLTLMSAATNLWAVNGNVSDRAGVIVSSVSGYKSLSATLDRLSLITANGTDTFDGGTVNIAVEF